MTKFLKLADIGVFLLISIGAVITINIYWSGLSGPFLLDDIWNLAPLGSGGGITTIESALHFVFSNVSGPLGRPVSMLSFLVNDQGWPANEFDFKLTNLLIHLACGLVLFGVVSRILMLSGIVGNRALLLSVFVVVLWWVHPFNVSTVLYVIQRMTQLATLFGLLALWFYLVARVRVQSGLRSGFILYIFGVLPCIALSVLSKESGVITFLLILLIEWIFFSFKASSLFRKLFGLTIVVPVLVMIVYLIVSHWDIDSAYARRHFTFSERLFTEPRVIFEYISYILMPKSIGTGLIHDDFVLSVGWFEPITTLYSIIGLMLIVIISWLARKKYSLLSFGLLFFLAGHLLESTFLPLEIYFEHRNYLPMIGLLLVLVFFMNKLLDMESKNIGLIIVLLTSSLYIGGASALTKQNARIWSNVFDLLTIWATEHPDSLRAQRIYGQFLGKTDWYLEGIDVLTDAYEKFPEDIGLQLATINIFCSKNLTDASVTLEDISENMSKARFNGGLITISKNFGDLFLSGKCASESNQQAVDKIFHELVTLPGFTAAARADLLYYHAEAYAERGDLNRAMALMEQAFENQKVVVVPFRQAQFLASAGLFDEALEFVEKAYKVDALRPRSFLTQSDVQSIDQLKVDILRAKNDGP